MTMMAVAAVRRGKFYCHTLPKLFMLHKSKIANKCLRILLQFVGGVVVVVAVFIECKPTMIVIEYFFV